MTKEELIGQLRELHNQEELAILIYTKHLESTFFLSQIPPAGQKEIKDILLTLAMESEVHARMFEATIKQIQGSERNVY